MQRLYSYVKIFIAIPQPFAFNLQLFSARMMILYLFGYNLTFDVFEVILDLVFLNNNNGLNATKKI